MTSFLKKGLFPDHIPTTINYNLDKFFIQLDLLCQLQPNHNGYIIINQIGH